MIEPVGKQIGHYRLVEKIGEGGMGIVYKALDERLDREVAVKVLPERFSADRKRMARFEREARAAAAVDHPNILAVLLDNPIKSIDSQQDQRHGLL